MSVEWARVGEVLELRRAPIDIDPTGAYKRIGIYSWGRGVLHRPEVSGAEMGSLRYFTFPIGALMLSNIQAWEAAVAVTTEAESGFVASNRFLPYVPKAEGIDVRYLVHYFVSERGLAQLRTASPGTQVRNRTLGKRLFEGLEIPLPPLDEQRRIASHLDRLSDVVARRASATALAHAWPIALRDRVVAEAGGANTPLSHVLSARSPEAVRQEATYRITGVYSFGRGLLDRGALAGHETKYASMTTLQEGDVVYSKLGAFEDAVAVVDGTFAGTQVSPEFPVFEVVEEIDPIYLRAALTTTSFAEALIQAATGVGARQKRVSPSAFLSLEIPIPNAGRQRAVSKILGAGVAVTAQEKRASELSKALLPAARNEIFNGMR